MDKFKNPAHIQRISCRIFSVSFSARWKIVMKNKGTGQKEKTDGYERSTGETNGMDQADEWD